MIAAPCPGRVVAAHRRRAPAAAQFAKAEDIKYRQGALSMIGQHFGSARLLMGRGARFPSMPRPRRTMPRWC